MISEAPYSTDANVFRMVNKAANVIILSLIRDHGMIPFNLVRENKGDYVQQSTRCAQGSRMMY